MGLKVKGDRYSHVDAGSSVVMLSSPLARSAPVSFPLPSGPRPFLPLLPPQPPPGNFLPGPPPNFPGFLFSPLVPGLHNAAPLHQQQYVSGGPMNWNFQHPTTPHIPSGEPPRWSQHQRPPWKTRGKQSRPTHRGPGTNVQPGSGSKPVLFVCVPCHKEYKSQQTYNIHMATHIKCSHCDFECSKGAMHDHELIHYLPAELNFTSQEDIEKWREERRRNFPTVETVRRKEQLQEEREKRGDVIRDTPLYRYVSRVCGSDRRRGFNRGRGRKHSHWVVGSNRRYSEGVRDDRDEVTRQPWVRGQRGRGRGRGARRGRNTRPRNKDGDVCSRQGLKYVSARKPTLLEKLLAKEVRVEQNAMLQCVRHIVRSDFFGAGGTNRPSPTADTGAGGPSTAGVGAGGQERIEGTQVSGVIPPT